MKRTLIMFMAVVTFVTVSSINANATTSTPSNENDGIKFSRTETSIHFDHNSTPVTTPEFKLDGDDAVALLQAPGCGSGGNRGWQFDHTEGNVGNRTYYESRSCTETIYIISPYGGVSSFSYTTTETRVQAGSYAP